MDFNLDNYGYAPKIHKLSKESVKPEWQGMPSDDIDPKLKKGDWCLAWARFIYSMFYNNQTYTTWDKLREYRLYRLYGAGQQPREFYMDWLDPKDSKTNARAGYYNVSWDIWSPAPKFRRVVIGRFETQETNIVANAIDKKSGVEREDAKWAALAESLFGNKEQAVKRSLKMEGQEKVKYVPESREELEMYTEMGGFKMKKEIDIEKALAFTDHISDNKELKRMVFGDFFDINIAAVQDYFDPIDKKVKKEYIDPELSIFDYSNERKYRDMRFWATQRLYSIKRLRAESGLPEEKLRAYALSFANNYGNPNTQYIEAFQLTNYRNKDGVYVYDQYKVPVMYCEMTSIDTKYKTTRQTKMGPVTFDSEYGKVHDTDRRKTEIKESQNIYTCNWIIGSDCVFSDGQLDLVPRDQKKAVAMTAHVYALPGRSIVSSIKDNLDQLQLTKLNLQNAQANSSPDGLKIEFGALNNINLGDGDKTPLEVLKVRRMTGHMIYKATMHNGKYNTYASPIEKLEGGMGKVFEDCVRSFELNFNQISEITGIDRFSAASQKPGETTATEVNEVSAATTDALQPQWAGYVDIMERAARNIAYRIQTIIKYIPTAYDVYYPVLGRATMEELKISRDITAASYGIKIEARPSGEQKQQVMIAATEALKPGKDGENISFAEYLLIMEMVNMGQIKHAIAILNFRLNKRRKEALLMQEENMRLNGENALKIEQAKEAKELKLVAAKAEEERKTELLKAYLAKDAAADETVRQTQQMIIEHYLGSVSAQPTGAPQSQAA